MKRTGILIFCLAFAVLSDTAYGDGFLVEVKGSYFQPKDKYFKDIYGNGLSYGGEIDISLWKWISLWGGGHYFTKIGRMTFYEEETEIRIMPFYAGIRLHISLENVIPYIGFGIAYFSYQEINPIGNIKKADVGYIGQIGLIFKIVGPLFFDIKGSYSLCKVKPVEVEADLGGFQGGIGIGFEF